MVKADSEQAYLSGRYTVDPWLHEKRFFFHWWGCDCGL